MNCGTCRKCAYFDMSVNFASIGTGESPINLCCKHQLRRSELDPRCEDYKEHEHRKNWRDD